MGKEESPNNKKNFKDSFKATLLFSGVQIYQIIIRIVRSKFVAMLLGPAGMGITALLHSTTDLVSATTNFGLRTSGVKSIAAARVADDQERIEKTIAVLRRLIFITGIFGTLLCAILSPIWSQQSFGNNDYIWSFFVVSIVILLDQVNQGEQALLQGLQQRRMLARVSVIGHTLGLFMTVPLYYIWGVKAIVPVLVLFSVLILSITSFYVRKLNVHRVKVTYKETFSIGYEMLKLGLLLSIQHLLSQGSVYLVRNYVSQTGGLEQVGLYSAGTTIVNMYLGLVFTAMATDYFPRLAATKSVNEMSDAIRSQAEIALIMFAPIIIAFVVFIKPVILILYSDKFIPVESMLYWAMSGTLIKAMAWSLSYSILAKANAKVFFYNEVIAITYTFVLNMFGYKYFGLAGFGMSVLVSYILYFLQMHLMATKYFHFNFGRNLWILFVALNILVLASLVIKVMFTATIGYLFGGLLLVISAICSYCLLDKKIGIKKSIIQKFRNNA